MFAKVLSFDYSFWFSITDSDKAKETQQLHVVEHIDIEDTEETFETATKITQKIQVVWCLISFTFR